MGPEGLNDNLDKKDGFSFEKFLEYPSFEAYQEAERKKAEDAEKERIAAEKKLAEARAAEKVTADDWNYRKWLHENAGTENGGHQRSAEERQAQIDAAEGESNINSATNKERTYHPTDMYPHVAGEDNAAYSERFAAMRDALVDLPKDADGAIDMDKIAEMRKTVDENYVQTLMGGKELTPQNVMAYEKSLVADMGKLRKEIAEMQAKHEQEKYITEAQQELALMAEKLDKVRSVDMVVEVATEDDAGETTAVGAEEGALAGAEADDEVEKDDAAADAADDAAIAKEIATQVAEMTADSESENQNLDSKAEKREKIKQLKLVRNWKRRVKAAVLAAVMMTTMVLTACGVLGNNSTNANAEAASEAMTTTATQGEDGSGGGAEEVDLRVDLGKRDDESLVAGGVERYINDGRTPEYASNGVAYNYEDYADFEHKVSHNAFGTSRAEFFNDKEGSIKSILNDTAESVEKLASHVAGNVQVLTACGWSEDEARNMSAEELECVLSWAPNGGELQQKIMAEYEKALTNENTEYVFYHEHDSEETYYMRSLDGAKKLADMNSYNMVLGRSVSKRNGAPQLRLVFRDADGKVLHELDLNMNCGWQPNMDNEAPDEDLPAGGETTEEQTEGNLPEGKKAEDDGDEGDNNEAPLPDGVPSDEVVPPAPTPEPYVPPAPPTPSVVPSVPDNPKEPDVVKPEAKNKEAEIANSGVETGTTQLPQNGPVTPEPTVEMTGTYNPETNRFETQGEEGAGDNMQNGGGTVVTGDTLAANAEQQANGVTENTSAEQQGPTSEEQGEAAANNFGADETVAVGMPDANEAQPIVDDTGRTAAEMAEAAAKSTANIEVTNPNGQTTTIEGGSLSGTNF